MLKVQKSFTLGRYRSLYFHARLVFDPRPQNVCVHSTSRSAQAVYVQEQHPSILDRFDEFVTLMRGKKLAVFLDYDGKHPRNPAVAYRSKNTYCAEPQCTYEHLRYSDAHSEGP